MLDTINVIQANRGIPFELHAFLDDDADETNKAECLFSDLIHNDGQWDKDKVAIAIEQGQYTAGDYSVFLMRSK